LKNRSFTKRRIDQKRGNPYLEKPSQNLNQLEFQIRQKLENFLSNNQKVETPNGLPSSSEPKGVLASSIGSGVMASCFQFVGGALQTIGNLVASAVKAVGDFIGGIIDGIVGFFKGLFSAIEMPRNYSYG